MPVVSDEIGRQLGPETLHRTSDKPVDGVQVSAMFFMPAMPAMGMAMTAEHAVASVSARGQGGYGGLLELESEGTWQVTVTVRRAGAAIATKMLLVDATGGMR